MHTGTHNYENIQLDTRSVTGYEQPVHQGVPTPFVVPGQPARVPTPLVAQNAVYGETLRPPPKRDRPENPLKRVPPKTKPKPKLKGKVGPPIKPKTWLKRLSSIRP